MSFFSYTHLALLLLIIPGCWWNTSEHISFEKQQQLASTARSLQIDFDTSMQLHNPSYAQTAANHRYLYDLFKALYERNHPARTAVAVTPKIEKIVHHIWLGGKMPACYEAYYQSWRTHNPSWKTVFWTDSAENYDRGTPVVTTFKELEQALRSNNNVVVNVAGLQFDNKIFFDASPNYGEKSDILKWEIVYRCGGMYVDTDYECLQSFDLLAHLYDFYTGMQPLDTVMVQLGAGLFAAKKGHPLLQATVEGIKRNRHIPQIVAKTGPIHFTRTFLEQQGAKTTTTDMVLPASYLYPCSYEQRGMGAQVWQKPESFAVHHWAGSWLKPEAFVRNNH